MFGSFWASWAWLFAAWLLGLMEFCQGENIKSMEHVRTGSLLERYMNDMDKEEGLEMNLLGQTMLMFLEQIGYQLWGSFGLRTEMCGKRQDPLKPLIFPLEENDLIATRGRIEEFEEQMAKMTNEASRLALQIVMKTKSLQKRGNF